MFYLCKYSRFFVLIAVAITGLLCSSCVTETPKYMKRQKVHEESQREYPKIKDYRVKLQLVTTRRSFNPGHRTILTYKFKNIGKKPLRIDEWFMNDPDNIKIYYHPWKKGLNRLKRAECKVMNPILKKPVRRFELVLNPGNSVLIRKELSFVKDMPPGKQPEHKKYFVIATLNLKSIRSSSKASIIELKAKTIYTQGEKI